MSAAHSAEIEELLGAYALDALEPDEARVVDDHLATCPRCRQEVAAHLEVAGKLGSVGQEAPPGVWDKIAARLPSAPPRVELDRMSFESAPAGMSAPRADRSPRERASGEPSRGERSRTGRAPSGGSRPRSAGPGRAGRRRPLRALAGLAVVAVIAVLGVQVVRLDHRVNTVSTRVSAGQTPSMAAVVDALSSPGARQLALTASSGQATLARVVVDPNGTGYLYDMRMPTLSSDRTYELWGIVNNARVPYGLLGARPPTVAKFQAEGQATALAITEEPGGGVATSNQPPVAQGTLHPV